MPIAGINALKKHFAQALYLAQLRECLMFIFDAQPYVFRAGYRAQRASPLQQGVQF